MMESGLKAYTVEVQETFRKEVIVYAESDIAAVAIADELSSRGELGGENWTDDARKVSCIRQATVDDFETCEKFGF